MTEREEILGLYDALLDRLLMRAMWAENGGDVHRCSIAADAVIADLAAEGHITAEQALEKSRAWANVCEQEALRRMARLNFESAERSATIQ